MCRGGESGEGRGEAVESGQWEGIGGNVVLVQTSSGGWGQRDKEIGRQGGAVFETVVAVHVAGVHVGEDVLGA